MALTNPRQWQASSRRAGCAWMLAGLGFAALGLLALLALFASSWGGGFAGPIQLLLLVVGLALGVLSVGLGLTGAEALFARRGQRP